MNPAEVLRQDEQSYEAELSALFADVCIRRFGAPEDDLSPLERWAAWDVTKSIWRYLRAGMDAWDYDTELRSMGYMSRRREQLVEDGERRARRRVHIEEVHETMRLFGDVCGMSAPALEVISGGRSG